jgi:Flp pilus assembly protein TadG
MENPANTVEQRWTTFSSCVGGGLAPDQQNLVVSGMLSMKNATDDAALAAWRWSTADQTAAVNAMAQAQPPAGTTAQQPQAYLALAAYTYGGKTLPIKVGAGVALQYITRIS